MLSHTVLTIFADKHRLLHTGLSRWNRAAEKLEILQSLGMKRPV